MTLWDIVDHIINRLPPVALNLIGMGATVLILTGFGKYGVEFFRRGFSQKLSSSLDERFDALEVKLSRSMDGRFDTLNVKIDGIKGEIDGIKGEIGGIKGEIDGLRVETREEISVIKMELADIKLNHFSHLKGYLTIYPAG
ncbi:MAG: hypothetical protein LBB80_03025 [Treponema sp.]|jgi:hypothetical protein|nr:hypothetical protein [Treponema sp.]